MKLKTNQLWAIVFVVVLFVLVVRRSRPEFFGAFEVMNDIALPRPRANPMSEFLQDDETTGSSDLMVSGAEYVIKNNTGSTFFMAPI